MKLVGLMLGVVLTTTLGGCGGSSGSSGSGGSDSSATGGGKAAPAADTTDISGPPTINAMFGSREPRKCASVKNVPTTGQAAALTQCMIENGDNEGMTLLENVRVEMASARPYEYNADGASATIDTTSEVYPIRVTADQYGCSRQQTCQVHHSSDAPGTCYKTTFGDWNCNFSLVNNVEPGAAEVSPPTTY